MLVKTPNVCLPKKTPKSPTAAQIINFVGEIQICAGYPPVNLR